MRRRFAVLLASLLGLSLVGSAQAAAGPVASRVEGLFWAITAFAFGVSFVVYGALFWFLIRYRRSVSPTADPVEGNRRLEILWTVIPTIILVIITVISVPVLVYTDTVPPPDYTVVVSAERFSWNFEYYENGRVLGTDPPDATTSGELWIQAQSVVRLVVTSHDVIHSFAVVELGIKIDAMPHHNNTWWLQADEPGEYLTQCAEFCGEGHYGMRATIHVFTAQERQQQAVAAGVPPRPYGLPPVPLQVRDVRMREFAMEPATLEYSFGASVTMRVFNDAPQAYDFRIDVAVEGTNYTGMIPAYGNRTIAFALNTTAPANVSYGPTDLAARAQGMVGNLTIRAGRLITIIFLESGCPPPKTFCLDTIPSGQPLRIANGETIVFELRNDGVSMHNFRMDYPEVEVFYEQHIAGGQTVILPPVTFNEDYSGKYWCDVAGHRALGMEGDFVVGAGSTPPAQVPIFEMMLLSAAITVPATFAYLFHHARSRDEEPASA